MLFMANKMMMMMMMTTILGNKHVSVKKVDADEYNMTRT